MDFDTITLATDNVRPSKNPETWNIGGLITVALVVGVAMVAEALGLLEIGWSQFGLANNSDALCSFSFLLLLYFSVFSTVSARERRAFWSTMPSKPLITALTTVAIIGTLLTHVGLPGLVPLPWWQPFAIFGYAIVSCLVVNDAVKVRLIRWRVPSVA